MPRNIRITPYFGTGNQLFQYMMAQSLRFLSKAEITVSGHNIPEFLLSAPPKTERQAFRITIQNHIVPQKAIASILADCHHVDVNINSLSCRMVYYLPFLDNFRALICPNIARPGPVFGPEHLVINIRAGDIMAGIHPHYMPLPLSFYRQIIKETGLLPVFMGQIKNESEYCISLRAAFPNAIFVASTSAVDDFNLLLSSQNIILSISTFAWLAAWLSKSAKNIYFPVAGLYNPGYRPDIDLLPISDARYHFYDLALPAWDGSAAVLSELIHANRFFQRVLAHELRQKFHSLLGTEGLQVFRPPLT